MFSNGERGVFIRFFSFNAGTPFSLLIYRLVSRDSEVLLANSVSGADILALKYIIWYFDNVHVTYTFPSSVLILFSL